MLRKFAAIIIFLSLIYVPSACKQWFSPTSEPITENYYQIFSLKTGQTTCYDATGTKIPCGGTGQDGEYQRGVSLSGPRFRDNGNGTITDRLTGLMWEKSPSTTTYTWSNALTTRIAELNSTALGGYSDWRLPNVNELASLMNFGQGNTAGWLNSQGFYNVQPDIYWSSSRYSSTQFWYLGMNSSTLNVNNAIQSYYVLAVRGNGNAGAVSVPKTGVTISVSTGDDGQFQRGVSWPSPRFIDNGNSTITDRLTGLMWIKDGSASGSKIWQSALDYVKTLNTGGYTDWRLPNINELASLSHYGQPTQAVWLNSQGFTGMQENSYWSSSTYAGYNAKAYYVSMANVSNCFLSYDFKNSSYKVLAVRGGQ